MLFENAIIKTGCPCISKYWLNASISVVEVSKEVIINPVGMACGASIGPGLCAAFYQGKPISEDLKEEKAIMAQIESEVKALDKKALK